MGSRSPIESSGCLVAPGAPVVQVGLVGRGIQRSQSPKLHVREAAAQGFDLTYSLIDLDAEPWALVTLAQALDEVEARGFAGVNITYPFKQDVLRLVQRLSPDAERLGAVNTVIFEAGHRVGHNTDWSGFAENLRRGLPGVRKTRVVQMGAGGAGAATAYALCQEGLERLTIFDLDLQRANSLVDKMNALFGRGRSRVGEDLAADLAVADGLVNATPIGMEKYPGSPVPDSLLRPELWVADIVYVPMETRLLALARARGCRILDGGGMAVFQAADAFGLLTGRKADTERMRAAFLRDLEAAA
jgi:shikimate dehydrogenase